MNIEINIDNYLSEDEKKSIVIDAFREAISKKLFKTDRGDLVSDSEIQRVIGNISHNIIVDEVSKILPNYKDLIKAKVGQIITSSNLSYHVFKKKDVYESDESLAISYIKETVASLKPTITEKVKDSVANFDFASEVRDQICDQLAIVSDTVYELVNTIKGNNKQS